ncbi:MAG: hypothetical protein ACRCU5_09905 [Rhizobiaceae bacterium]
MMVDKPHQEFEVSLQQLLQSFGYEAHGRAKDSGNSSNTKILTENAKPRALEDYRFSNRDKNWFGPRPAAYLAAYVDFFGPKFSFEILNFIEGPMHPDKAIMTAHLHYGCATITTDKHFLLTEKGRALIAPFISVTDQAMEAAHAAR